MPVVPPDELDHSLGKKKTPRELLLEAKECGADDAAAIEYAGLTQEDFERLLASDARLETDMLAARANALMKHLKWIETASQWQAHEFLLLKFWPSQFSRPAGEDRDPAMRELKQIFREMSPDQARRSTALLRSGLELDNLRIEQEKLALQLPAPCPTTPKT